MSTAIAVRDSSLLAMIERVATTPEMDLGKLERLIELQEWVLTQQARMDYAAAMSAVQGRSARYAGRPRIPRPTAAMPCSMTCSARSCRLRQSTDSRCHSLPGCLHPQERDGHAAP